MKQLNKTITSSFLLIGGTILITLAGINWSVGLAAWLAPVLLLRYVRSANWYHFVFFYFALFVSGFISQSGNNLYHLPEIDIFNGVSFAILTSLAYVVDRLLYKKHKPFYYSLIFPSAVIVVEYGVSSLIGTWGVIAHTQFHFKPLMQLASIFGIYSVSFVVSWFPAVVNWLIDHRNQSFHTYKKLGIYAGILMLILLFGTMRLKTSSPEARTVKIAALFSETDIHEVAKNEKDVFAELSSDYSLAIPRRIFSDSLMIRKLINRSKEAACQGAKIVVWNEAAIIINQERKEKLISSIKYICKSKQVYILLSFLEECKESGKKPLNNVSVLISPEGNLVWEYLKSYLHPYAEAPMINKGNSKIPVFTSSYGVIANVICADLDMNNFIRQAGKQEVDILLVPAYDWEGITPLHAQMANIHAIQYGLSIVRSNGKGLSTFYNNIGNTLAANNTPNSKAKIVYADVPVKSVKTIYTTIGDLIVYLGILFLLFISVFNFVFKNDN